MFRKMDLAKEGTKINIGPANNITKPLEFNKDMIVDEKDDTTAIRTDHNKSQH